MFNGNQFFRGRGNRTEDRTAPYQNYGVQGPTILNHLPPSQTLNGLRGKWLGANTNTNRPSPTEARQGRGGRPPVFAAEARPLQERVASAAHRHRPASVQGQAHNMYGRSNFFNATHRRRPDEQ